MELAPLDIAVSFYELAAQIFVSLKKESRTAIDKARSEPELKDLTFTQLRILLAVRYGRDQVGKLARSAQVAQPAMSKLVDYLIGLDYLVRSPHPTDRRQIKLSLTPKGIAMTKRVLVQAAEKYVGALEGLSPADLQKLMDGIAVMYRVIETTRNEEKGE